MSINDAYIKDINDKLDAFQWVKAMTKDCFVDAKDTVQNWWVAKAIDVEETKEELNLHFDGWSTKYDEVLPFLSTRIEPFRMITKGYTGMKNSTRRDEWKYTFHDLDALK